MRILQWSVRALIVLVALVAAGLVVDALTFDREKAERDYARLKQGLAQHYANLDWQAEHRNLDLVALDRTTSQALAGAWGRLPTYFAIRDFVATFRDPHLQLKPGDAPAGIRVGTVSDVSGISVRLCQEAGYEEEDMTGRLGFEDHPDWKPIESENFPAGLVGDLGVIRIAEFGENRYLAACSTAAREGQSARGMQLATREALQDELRMTLGRLRRLGAARLAVDLTGNGGGTEWSTDAAALFVEGTLRRRKPVLPAPACDRTRIWSGDDVCPIYVTDDGVETIEGEGAWSGPLVLLIDRNSASATEEFAVWLTSSDVVTLIGERTLGAGCGYMDGGKAVQLESIPFHVMMPNCSRFTLDGVNEIEGLTPDVEIDLTQERAFEAILDKIANEPDGKSP